MAKTTTTEKKDEIIFERVPQKKQSPGITPSRVIQDTWQRVRNNVFRERSSTSKKMNNLIQKSGRLLYEINSFFPFDLFPDEMIIDESKVNIIKRYFFFNEHVHSIPIRNIVDVFVETSVFFATLRIVDRGFVENLISVHYLKKEEALKARRIIQGLIVSTQERIDLSGFSAKDLAEKVDEIGRASVKM